MIKNFNRGALFFSPLTNFPVREADLWCWGIFPYPKARLQDI